MAAAVVTDRTERRRKTRGDQFSMERAYEGPPEIDASDEDKANYALSRFAVQNDHYTGQYRAAAKNICFLVGKHWVTWDPRHLTYKLDTDVPEWRQQPVTNVTYAVFRAAVAKLTKNKPTLEVVPPTGDSEDRDSAQLGEAIIQFLWRYLKKPQKVVRAIGWLLTTGKVYLKSDWDPEAGPQRPRSVLVEIPHPENPAETIDVECAADENGEPLRREPLVPGETAIDGGKPYDLDAEPEVEPIGEITFDVVDPLSVRLNPEATSHEDATEYFVARMIPIEDACAKYGIEDPAAFKMAGGAGDEGDTKEDFERFISSVVSGPPDPFMTNASSIGTSREDGIGERVLELAYYGEPCAEKGYPKGRHWVTVGGLKVWPPKDDPEHPNGEAELPNGFWPPYVGVVDTPIPGQPEGVALLSTVVPLNEQLNYIDARIAEYHTMMAMGGVIWVHPSDRGIEITSEPGQVKVSKGLAEGKPPIREQLLALPGPVYAERDVLLSKMRTVSGMSDVDMAQRPEGVTAGRAFLVLQEASDAPLVPLLTALEDALCEIGRRELVLAQRKYTEERVIQIRGDQGKWEHRSFVGADLTDGLDVRVQTGSMYPWSKSAQWDSKLSLIQALPGMVTDPTTGMVDEEKLARLLDSGVPGMKAFESENNADLVEIDREHAMFEAYDPSNPEASNQLPQLAFWQTQPVHLEQHYNFMKRNYARFERWSDPAKLAFMEHMRLTADAVQQLVASVTPPDEGGDETEEGQPAPAEGGPAMALVPPGGSNGRAATPTANKKQDKLRLTRGDRAAAGQTAR